MPIYKNQDSRTIGAWIKIRKGAKQGCGMSPEFFFNLYEEEVTISRRSHGPAYMWI